MRIGELQQAEHDARTAVAALAKRGRDLELRSAFGDPVAAQQYNAVLRALQLARVTAARATLARHLAEGSDQRLV